MFVASSTIRFKMHSSLKKTLDRNLLFFSYKTENFIQRWGTHFIKSARFGGQLELRKRMDAKEAGSKTEFAEKMEFEYKSLFASVGAKYEKKGGMSYRQQTKTTSTEIEAKGGSQKLRPFSLMFTRQHLRRNLRNGCSRFLDIQSRIDFRWVQLPTCWISGQMTYSLTRRFVLVSILPEKISYESLFTRCPLNHSMLSRLHSD